MTRSSLFAPPTRCCFSSTSRLVTTVLFILAISQACSAAYYGKLIGKLSEFHHGVSGEVYAVDGRTLYIKDFTYDGEGPAAFFYAGTSKTPNGNGFRVRDERGTTDLLKRYRKKDITLTLPEGKTLNNIKWFSVYCDEFAVNFGDVRIPRGFDYPRPQKLAPLNGVHGVSSEPVVVVDAQTLLIPGFSYDGEAPDAKFWVGSGPHPSPQGIRVPDENGAIDPLRSYHRKTIVLTLPSDLTVHQIGHFGVWCEAFTVDFGHIQIPANLNVPPSLRMLGVSPQSKLNCEVLEDSLAFEVRWAVAGDSIVVQLVGKLDAGQYMSFGLSPQTDRSVMVGGDPVVAWVDKQTLQGYAADYFLDAKSQCSGGRGSCPDDRIRENTNSVRLLNAAMVNGYSIVTYQRPLKASDELDLPIRTNISQAIIWAIGPLNERQETSFHSHYLKTDRFIEFGRPPAWNCPMPDGDMPHPPTDNIKKETKRPEPVATTRRPQRPVPTPAPASKKGAWVIPPIQCDELDDGIFYAQLGPTGGKHGYPAITGHVGWGISWYINGLLIPEINVVRNKTYTFVTEGGENPDIPARYHPFYITDDPIGGYQHKTPEEKAKVKIFAGVRRQGGTAIPTGTGRLCHWNHDPDTGEADDFESFGAFQRSLTLKCDSGEPGFVEWTPDANTPDTVYYQCFTHRYLGWKINVFDSCETAQGAASETHEVYAQPAQNHGNQLSDLESGSSIRVTSKVTPAPEFYHHYQHHSHPQQQQTMHYQYHQRHYPHYQKYSNKHHAMNPAGNLIITNSHNNNNNNNKKAINAQLTSTRGNGIGGIEIDYEQRNPYEMTLKSYEEQVQSLPMRSSPYQPTKLMHQNQYHHHHHHHHHLPPRHHQPIGTRVQGLDADAGSLGPMRNNHRTQSSQANSVAAYYDDLQVGRGGGNPVSWSHLASGPSTNSASTNGVTLNQHLTEHDQEIHQSSPVPVSIIASPNQLSNIIPDKRPIMSYGQMKFAYPHPGSAQYIYSRPGHSHPHKTTQLILRRPMIQPVLPVQTQPQRRPILGTTTMSNAAKESSQSQQIFMERKKSTYPGLSRIMVGMPGQQSAERRQVSKFSKMPNKQRFKIESKISSEAQMIDRSTGRTSISKPAQNTGFDPDSIVIEGGFKPIIRDTNRETNVGRSQQFIENLEGYQMDEAAVAENHTEEKLVNEENFEPMFVPSPLDRKNSTKKQRNDVKSQAIQMHKNFDDLDDMEMAADRLDSYYLPPPGSSAAPKKINDRIGTGTLIAYDGKRVEDSSLARSIPRVEAKRSRSRLTSEILSRTPQFGKFKGELPPPIPTDVRPENIPQLELGGLRNKNPSISQTSSAITKLSPFERSKRSTQIGEVHAIFDIPEKTNISRIAEQANHDHSMHSDEESTLSSTGQMLITNIQYVFLTIVLYFAI